MKDEPDSEQFKQQIAREAPLRAELLQWQARYEEASEQARIFYNADKKLQKEIKQLQERSLKSFAYRITFQYKKLLHQKQDEAAVLAVQYNEIKQQQKELETQIHSCENGLLKIKGAKKRLAQIEEENISALKATIRMSDNEFCQIEEEISSLQERAKKLRAILHTAHCAYMTAEEILNLIRNAEQLGELDLLGGKFFTGLEKHKQLDRAQNLLSSLSEQVRLFQGELSGIHLQDGLAIHIGGFLKFSDFAMDGIIADSLVLRRIKKVYEPIRNFCRQLESAACQINAQLAATEEERAQKEGRLQQKMLLPNKP